MEKSRKNRIEIDDQQKPVPKEGEKEEHLKFASRFARKSKNILEEVWEGFGSEATETKDMSVAFFRLLEHKLRLSERNDPLQRKK